jgi:hypothetical protein
MQKKLSSGIEILLIYVGHGYEESTMPFVVSKTKASIEMCQSSSLG